MNLTDRAAEIVLAPGEEHALMLESPGGTGYTWEAEILGPEDVLRVSLQSSEPRGGAVPPGSGTWSSEQRWVIEALRPGTAEVRLALRRPWERQRPPARVVTLRVTVKESGADADTSPVPSGA